MHIIAAAEKSTVTEGKISSMYKKIRDTVPHHRVKGESIEVSAEKIRLNFETGFLYAFQALISSVI